MPAQAAGIARSASARPPAARAGNRWSAAFMQAGPASSSTKAIPASRTIGRSWGRVATATVEENVARCARQSSARSAGAVRWAIGSSWDSVMRSNASSASSFPASSCAALRACANARATSWRVCSVAIAMMASRASAALRRSDSSVELIAGPHPSMLSKSMMIIQRGCASRSLASGAFACPGSLPSGFEGAGMRHDPSIMDALSRCAHCIDVKYSLRKRTRTFACLFHERAD